MTEAAIQTRLPAWAEELRRRYLAGEAIQFLLHGNVHDLVPLGGEFVPLRRFLAEGLLASKDVVMFYDPAEGLVFARPEMRAAFLRGLNARLMVQGRPAWDGELPTEPGRLLPLLEAYLLAPGQRAALVIDYAEVVAPSAELAFMSREDKASLVTLLRWAKEPQLLAGDNLILLVAETAAEIHRRILTSPQVVPVVVPRPDAVEREALIANRRASGAFRSELDDRTLARITSGLRLLQLDNLFRHAKQSGREVGFELVSAKRKEIIETECQGLVELIEGSHGLEAVGGMDGAKELLMHTAKAIREGHGKHVPMGVMLVGPMGTGKSFLASAFARESGLTCLALRNFREKWVGSTEANLQKILTMIQTMGSVMVVIDEVERALGGEDGDSGTSSRIFATLKAFMADTRHRGRILWLVMTNRPDKLDIDLKRPGRFDLKIPLFFPQGPEARAEVAEALLRKNQLALEGLTPTEAVGGLEGYSGADLEAVLLLADRFAGQAGRAAITCADVEAAAEDYIPNRDRDMTAFMELLAVFECSSRRLLPEAIRGIETATLQAQLDELAGRLRVR
ncbi:MAG: ATP-binding protein [Candidatus Sericytochromatia bacterium]|nr:ATP-binding protein [Candidatus Sericytochromatia bacterium]